MSKKGFTLIELLVVISIISLLSSVVLSNLNSSREKSYDLSLKLTIRSMFTYIENCRNGNGTVQMWANNKTGGGNICSNTSAEPNTWPPAPDKWVWRQLSVTNDAYQIQLSIAEDSPAFVIKLINCNFISCTNMNVLN